jgi:ribulose bisphosphate carboxylase small subunit
MIWNRQLANMYSKVTVLSDEEKKAHRIFSQGFKPTVGFAPRPDMTKVKWQIGTHCDELEEPKSNCTSSVNRPTR